MNDLDDSIRRFRGQLDTAVTRSRRARSEAQHQCAEFRAHTGELATGQQDGTNVTKGADGDAERHYGDAADFRMRMGLPVPERSIADSAVDDSSPEDSAPESGRAESGAGTNAEPPVHPDAEKSQEQTPSDGSDLDFSQRQMVC